jgi:hypothetical protein
VEAIDTLNLLFPLGHSPTDSLLEKYKKSFNRLGNCNRQPVFDISHYVYWQSRIEELQAILDGPRSGLGQLGWGKNRNDMFNSLTIWIAIFVAILTVVSIGTGVASTVFAMRALDLAQRQYQLSLVEIC